MSNRQSQNKPGAPYPYDYVFKYIIIGESNAISVVSVFFIFFVHSPNFASVVLASLQYSHKFIHIIYDNYLFGLFLISKTRSFLYSSKFVSSFYLFEQPSRKTQIHIQLFASKIFKFKQIRLPFPPHFFFSQQVTNHSNLLFLW